MKAIHLLACCGLALTVPLALAQPALAREPAAQHLLAPPADYVHERLLPLQGGQNFRDMGGYPTLQHRHVRWGLLFRSGSMYALTPADFDYLRKLGIQTVVDFRSRQERSAEPVTWPASFTPRVVAQDYDFGTLGQHMAGMATMTPDQIGAMMVSVYPTILTHLNGEYRELFAQLLAGKAPLAFNCSAGRDRTGIAAALLLTALGVPRETVIQDYLLTNRFFSLARTGPAAQTWGKVRPDMAQLMESSARPSIEAAFKVIDAHRGGAEGYLRDELGLDRAAIARLRALYTH